MQTSDKGRKARLLIQVGEAQLAKHWPARAQVLFDKAAALLPESSPDRGLARFNSALTLFFQGRYGKAKKAFTNVAKAPLPGVNRRLATLYSRHAASCEGYHAEHLAMGIPQPAFLDPLCGVSSIAICLRGLGLPHGKEMVKSKVRWDGEGSSMADLLASLPKFGLTGRMVTADEDGLKKLPMPVVAHVERDHFVSVVKADDKGVVYACSDCGDWPGGLVRLNWKQWRAMEADRYLVVAKPGSPQALALEHLPTRADQGQGHVFLASLTATGSGVVATAERILSALGTTVIGQTANIQDPYTPICGLRGTSPHCVPCVNACPIEGPGGGGGGGAVGIGGIGAGAGGALRAFGTNDPVNLATAEEEYTAQGGLSIYNPTGPSLYWTHSWYSLANVTPNGFGSGWTHPYNVRIEDNSAKPAGPGTGTPGTPGGTTGSTTGSTNGSTTGTPPDVPISGSSGGEGPSLPESVDPAQPPGANASVLVFPNTARIQFTTDLANPPTATSPVKPAVVPAGFPILVDWCYNTTTGAKYFVVTFEDRSKWTFEPCNGTSTVTGRCYPIKIADRIGNWINLNWSTFTFKTLDTVTGAFQAKGLVSITDSANSALLTVNYDSNARTTSVADRYGRSVYYTVQNFANTGVPSHVPTQTSDELTQVSQIVATGTSSPPMRFQYGYENYYNNDLAAYETIPFLHTISVPSPTGTGLSTATINYNSIGEVSNTIDANGNQKVYSPAIADVQVPGAPPGTTWPQPQANSGRVQVKNSSGTVVYQYDKYFDSRMNQTKLVNGLGQTVWTQTYGSPNTPYRASSVTDGNSRTSTYTYDQFGHVLTATSPKGTVKTQTFSYTSFPLGELVSVQSGSQTATSFTYHPNGLVATVSTPIPGQTGTGSTQTSTYTYNSVGNLTQILAPGNNVVGSRSTTFGYTTDGSYTQLERLGRPITVTDALGKVTHFRYDARGNPASSWDPLGNVTQFTFNIADQGLTVALPPTGQTGSGSSTQTKSYLFTGGPVVQVDARNEAGTLIRSLTKTYGKEGEPLTQSGSTENGGITYDALYRAKTVKDGNNGTTTYTYDLAGRLTGTSLPGATGANYDKIAYTSYDPVGNLLSSTDGKGQVANYTYADADGLITAVSYPGNTQYNLTYGYDAYGRLTSLTDASGSGSGTYDDRGYPLSSTRTYTGLAAQTTNYTYWPDGSRKTMVNVAGTWTYNYNANGWCTSLVSPAGTSSATYLDNGWESSRTLPNGTVSTYSYNAMGMLTSLLNQTSGAATLSQYGNFAYDGQFNLTGLTASVPGSAAQTGNTTYTYDTKDRLTQEASTRAGGYTGNFAYDSVNNPTTFKGITQTFNANNQQTSGGTFVYDGNGNPTTYKGSTLTYNPGNEVTAIGSTWTAGYVANGLRAWKQVGSTRTYYLYDSNVPVVELNSAGQVTAVNVMAPDGLVARKQGSNWTYYTFDQQGNVAQRLNSSQVVQSSSIYDAYGVESSTATPTDCFGYNAQWGYLLDRENGLYLCTHRYYDPATGRWLTRDPIGYQGGISLYAANSANPVNRTDPAGLMDSVSMTCRRCPALCAELITEGILIGGGIGIGLPAAAHAGEAVGEICRPLLTPIDTTTEERPVIPEPEIGERPEPGDSDQPEWWPDPQYGSPPFLPPFNFDDGYDPYDDSLCKAMATTTATDYIFKGGGSLPGDMYDDFVNCLTRKCIKGRYDEAGIDFSEADIKDCLGNTSG